MFARGLIVVISILFLCNFFIFQKFRNQISEKIKLIIKNPVFISLSFFILAVIVSTIFAVNKYNAFWGTIERTEGLVGIIFFFAVFMFSLLIFERKDWLLFFKLNLTVSFILLLKEFVQFFNGVDRPSSFLDNPTFLAGYLLFSIFCSFVIFSETKNKFWKISSVVTFILFILGIFIAQTRGTIVGLVVGFIFILIYGIIKGKNISYKKLYLRKVSIILLCLVVVFSTLFISTRKNEIWQQIPGFGRIATITSEDATLQTRLLTTKVGLEAINPTENGLKKFLIGWGADNCSLVNVKYFDPIQFKYEMMWFDRSHNKLIDVFVMNGLFGLIAYLAVFFFFFRSIFKRKDPSILDVGLILFGTSLLVHLLFVFDQITTSIPFFAVLAFVVYLTMYEEEVKIEKNKRNYENDSNIVNYVGIYFSIFTVFLIFVFLRNDLFAYFQMHRYISLRTGNDPKVMLNQIDSVFEPFTPAQMNIRNDFLSFTKDKYDVKNESTVALSDIAIKRAEEYVSKNPFDVRFLVYIAGAYSNKGIDLKSIELLNKGEELFRKMIVYAPKRPDVIFGLALNLFYQNKYDESFSYFEKDFDTSPNYFLDQKKNVDGTQVTFLKQGKDVQGIYIAFFQYFYKIKDKDKFIQTAKRLKENNYADSANLDKIIEYLEKNNAWPYINFTS